MANPITLTLVTPEYDFWSSSDYGEELMAFCYCIIQASSLFLGMRSLEKAKEWRVQSNEEGRVTKRGLMYLKASELVKSLRIDMFFIIFIMMLR